MATVNDATVIAACKEGDAATMTELIQSTGFEWKKCLQWTDKDQNEMDTPAVFIAVDYNQMEIVRLLLDAKGSDINIKDSNDYSPLQLASFNGNIEMVNLLMERGALVDQDALDLAKEHGHSEIISLLWGKIDLYAGMDNVDDIMIKASREGDVKKVQELIADGYNFDKWKEEDGTYQEYSPIYVAMKNGHIEVIREFLEAGVEAELHSTVFNHDVAPTEPAQLTQEQIEAIAEEDLADVAEAEAYVTQEETAS